MPSIISMNSMSLLATAGSRRGSHFVRPRILFPASSLLLGLAVLLQPPFKVRSLHSGGSFYDGFASAAGVVAKTYKVYDMAGTIVDPYLTQTVDSVADCSQLCAGKLVCSAFSFKRTADGRVECRIALGDFKWEVSADWKLLMEDIGPLNGYSLKTDGRFYKYFDTASAYSLTIPSAREMCWAEGGELGVPYPKFRRDAQRQVPIPDNPMYFVGITMPDWSSQRWVTDDGYSFFRGSSDPDQPWHPSVGWSDIPIISDNGNEMDGWYFVPRYENNARGNMCRKDNLYRKLPPNGSSVGRVRYYKMHYQLATPDEAARVCAAAGGALANVYAPGAWDAIEGYRMSTYMSATAGRALGKEHSFTVGGRVGPSWGSWVFPDGSTLTTNTNDSSQHWAPGEPNDGIGGGNASLAFMASSGGMGDIPADRANPRFLCEIVAQL